MKPYMRKILIGLGALAVVLVGFWVYVTWVGTLPMQNPPTGDAQAMDMPESESGSQPLGDTTLEYVGRSRYFRYDPETKDLVAEYGFQVLLNPGEGSSRWRVEQPYLVFYQSDYQCQIGAARGTFQVQMAGQQGIPTDAQLEENVTIHVIPNPGSRITETMIHMDDLAFSSERSEFSTDGPVSIESAKVQMEGYGMVLIFNMGAGKLEFLQIKDVDFLKVKNFVKADTSFTQRPDDIAQQDRSVRTAPGAGRRSSEPRTVTASEKTMNEAETAASTDTSTEDLYQCVIRDNVVIQYGDELILSGADMVDIMNIRFSESSKSDAPVTADDRTDERAERTVRSMPRTVNRIPRPEQSSSEETSNEEDASQDVVVLCDGGIIIQPMQTNAEDEQAADSSLAFEMSGAPLKIDRLRDNSENQFETLAHCGALSYKPSEDILRLFTNPKQPQILLNTQEVNSRIETSGNVAWDRRANRANIAGPGTVYITDSDDPMVEASEIDFYGVMDLLFAQISEDVSSATIQTINLTGGMGAILRRNGTLKTVADSAVLEFGAENELNEARLAGDVLFESLDGDEPSSQAAAESAIFTFDNNQIAAADLAGTVQFISASGMMESPNARVEFAPDATGTMQPKSIQTEGYSVLQALSSETDQPPAKFEARRIGYDMQTGMGLADGPIRFTFYQLGGAQGAAVEDWIPVTVTADENAEFIANEDRTLRQVIFNDNVRATRIYKTALYTQQDEFGGEQLVVDVDKTTDGIADLRRITFRNGRVYGESVKLRGQEELFKVRLRCRQMVYNRTVDDIQVMGPGDIQFDNSHADPGEAGNVGITFERPSYVLFDGFDSIRWNMAAHKIIANGDKNTMQLAYVPLVDGQVEKYIHAGTQRLDAEYRIDAAGKPVIERIYTDQGITYTEMNSQRTQVLRELIGQTLNYDAADAGWLTITGSDAMPAMVNDTRVPAIRYNINTGQLKTSLSSIPGVLGVPR